MSCIKNLVGLGKGARVDTKDLEAKRVYWSTFLTFCCCIRGKKINSETAVLKSETEVLKDELAEVLRRNASVVNFKDISLNDNIDRFKSDPLKIVMTLDTYDLPGLKELIIKFKDDDQSMSIIINRLFEQEDGIKVYISDKEQYNSWWSSHGKKTYPYIVFYNVLLLEEFNKCLNNSSPPITKETGECYSPDDLLKLVCHWDNDTSTGTFSNKQAITLLLFGGVVTSEYPRYGGERRVSIYDKDKDKKESQDRDASSPLCSSYNSFLRTLTLEP